MIDWTLFRSWVIMFALKKKEAVIGLAARFTMRKPLLLRLIRNSKLFTALDAIKAEV